MKRMLFTRILCVGLLCLLVFAAACSEQTENTESDISDTESTRELFSNLPEKTFDGESCVFLVEGDYMTTYASAEICPQENSYQRLNDAIEIRNNLVRERFGVTIEEVRTESSGDMLNRLRNNAMSDVNEYDIVMPYMGVAASLALDGAFYDLRTLPTIDLSAPYYDQGAVEGLSIMNRNYFTTGDLSLLSFACTHALVFNKDVLKDNGLEDPYTLVKNGEWTIDKLAEMARGITADNDGTPGMSYTDQYGFLVNGNFVSSLYIGTGARFSVKNASDEPQVALEGERPSSVFGRIFDLVNDKTATGKIEMTSSDFYKSATADGKNVWVAATEAVANKRVLFRAMSLIDIFDLGEYECNFGILPVPKLDEAQDSYYSRVSTLYATCVAIPTNVKNAEMSAIVLDAMMQASTETVKTAYFQTILKERRIQDTESEEMLDIIFNTRVYDLAFVYNWGGSGEHDANALSGFMNAVAFSGVNEFTSTWQRISSGVQSALEQTLADFNALA